MYTVTKDAITVVDQYFDVADTLQCGQVFRYEALGHNTYRVYSLDKCALVEQRQECVVIHCTDIHYWVNYFDLDCDYAVPNSALASTSDTMRLACQYGKGIRILRQDPLETIISFIISANNNIGRIKNIIHSICTALGQPTEHGYAFPTIEALANAPIELYSQLGAGYRAPYIHRTANMLLKEVPNIDGMNSAMANKLLQGYSGIGAKVADCILLFGYHRGDVVPVDTWIKKVYHHYYEQGHKDSDIAQYLVSIWGGNAGLAQQYLFHYERMHRQSIDTSV